MAGTHRMPASHAASLSRLDVPCCCLCLLQVNGVPVKAFVDSGARETIMTQECASKCYLTRLLDMRFAGMAVGVGSSSILGKIHRADLKVKERLIDRSQTACHAGCRLSRPRHALVGICPNGGIGTSIREIAILARGCDITQA